MRKAWLVTNQSGFAVVEILLASVIFALVAGVYIAAIIDGQVNTEMAGKRARAAIIAEEGIEATRNIRDDDYTNLTNGTHGLAISSDTWTFSGSSDVTDGFTRSVTIADVETDKKSVTSTVTWTQNQQRSGSITLVSYLTNWAKIVSTIGDWSLASQESSLNLTYSDNGMKVAKSGDYLFMVQDYYGGDDNLEVIDVSDPDSPSHVTDRDLDDEGADIFISGDYAYITQEEWDEELIIFDISTPSSPSEVTTLNLDGSEHPNGIYIVGDYAYIVKDEDWSNEEFFIIDISTPSSPSITGKLHLGGGDNRGIVVLGDYAYVSSNHNDEELKIIDISTKSAPFVEETYSVSGSSNGEIINGFGSTVFLGQSNGTLNAISVSNPSSPSLLGTFAVLDDINDISFGNDNKYAFIASDANGDSGNPDIGAEFQVVDITTPSSMSLLDTVNVSSDLNGIVYDSSEDRAYAVGENDSAELRIFKPTEN